MLLSTPPPCPLLPLLPLLPPPAGMPPPRQHVADSWQSAEFFSNKLLMEFRGKDENQVAWVRGLKVSSGGEE